MMHRGLHDLSIKKPHNGVIIVNQDAGYLTVDVANAFAKNYSHVVLFYFKVQ